MTDERDIRTILLDIVPALTEPEDRLAAVGARVSRARRRHAVGSALAAAVAVTLTLGVFTAVTGGRTVRPPAAATSAPSLVVPTATPEPVTHVVSCGTHPNATDNTPRAHVADGVVSVTLCAVGAPLFDPAEPWVRDHPDRTLDTHVAEMATRLFTYGNMMDCRIGLDGPFWWYTFLVEYDDGRFRSVSTMNMCGGGVPVVEDFLAYYRQQRVVDPATIASPTCPARYTAAGVDPLHSTGEPRDEIGVNRGDEYTRDPASHAFLPLPIVAAAVCDYAPHAGGYRIEKSWMRRADLAAVRDTLNAGVPPAPVIQLPPTFTNTLPNAATDCVTAALRHGFTSIFAVDTMGAVTEIRIFRDGCASTWSGRNMTAGVDPGIVAWLTAIGR